MRNRFIDSHDLATMIAPSLTAFLNSIKSGYDKQLPAYDFFVSFQCTKLQMPRQIGKTTAIANLMRPGIDSYVAPNEEMRRRFIELMTLMLPSIGNRTCSHTTLQSTMHTRRIFERYRPVSTSFVDAPFLRNDDTPIVYLDEVNLSVEEIERMLTNHHRNSRKAFFVFIGTPTF